MDFPTRIGSVFKSTYETKTSYEDLSESQKEKIGSENNKAKGRDGTQNFTPRPRVVTVSACTFDPSNKKRSHLCKRSHTSHELKGRPAVQGRSTEAAGKGAHKQFPQGSSESRLGMRTSSMALARTWQGWSFLLTGSPYKPMA